MSLSTKSSSSAASIKSGTSIKVNLQTQLSIVNKAIEIAVKQNSPQKRRPYAPSTSQQNVSYSLLSAPSLLKGSTTSPQLIDQLVGSDESFIIQTTGSQPVICPDCFNEINAKNFKTHQSRLCPNKVVTCPNLGCGHRLNLQNLRWHLQEECVFAVQRKQLIEQATLRALKRQEEENAKIQLALQFKKAEHKLDQGSTFAYQDHFVAEEEERGKDENHPHNSVVVVCSDCGEAMRESQLTWHLKDSCSFRKIMCPNFGCGCNAMDIPLLKIREHLATDCKAEKLKEKFIKQCKDRLEHVMCSTCGEQVQLCYFRQHNREKCPNRLVPCRNHHLGCPILVPLRERHLHEHVDENYERYSVYFPGHGAYLNVSENDVVEPWTAEFWIYRALPDESMKVHIKNFMLQVGSYELGYCAEFQIYRKVMGIVNTLKEETARSKERKDEFKNLSKAERALKQSEMMQRQVSLVNELQALIPVYSETVLSYMKAFQALAICVEAGLACVRDLHQAHHLPQIHDQINLEPRFPGEIGTVKKREPSYLQTKGTSSGTSDEVPQNENAESNENQSEKSHINVNEEEQDAVEGSESLHIEDSTLMIDRKRTTSLIPGELSRTLSFGQSFLSKLFTYSWTVIHTEDDLSMQPVEILERFLEQEQEKKDTLIRELGETIEYPLLPDLRVAKFLCEWLERPKSAMSNHFFTIQEWKDLLTLFALILKSDFDRLQDFRIEAGLLTPETKSADDKKSGIDQPFDEKREKALKKKEKEKQRRELKKLKNQEDVSASTNPVGDGESESKDGVVESVTTQQATAGSSKSNKELKLINRITEVFKSGSGAEILHESSTANKDGHRSHICVSMHSGLTILKTEKPTTVQSLLAVGNGGRISGGDDDTLGEKDHHYELLFPDNEFKKLCNMNGNFGFISVQPDKEPQLLSEIDGGSGKNGGNNTMADILGNQSCTLSAKVPRGKWTHLCVVVSKKPQNRVTCYMDGIFVGSFRDAAFPLPMLSIGGTPFSLQSFQGCLLDVRYWSYQRSAPMVADYMHRLVEVDQPGSEGIEKINQRHVNGESVLVNRGLIAWWTFDDGPEFQAVTDVTRNRFKTPFGNKLHYHIPSDTGLRKRFAIPFDVLAELPTELLELLRPEDNPRNMGVDDKGQTDRPEESRPTTGISDANVGIDRKAANKFGMLELGQRYASRYRWIVADSIRVYTAPINEADVAVVNSMNKNKKNDGTEQQQKGKFSRKNNNQKMNSPPKGKDDKSKQPTPKLPYYLAEEQKYSTSGGSPLPVPSFREHHLCAFELRRHRLAKSGRELQRIQACPLGCSQQIRALHMRFHIRYECMRRIVCCRFDCCGAMFPCEEREKHERDDCVLAVDRLRLLNNALPQNSIVSCSLCSQGIKLRDLEHHKLNVCPHRLLFCPRKGCSFSQSMVGAEQENQTIIERQPRLPAHLLERHLDCECDSPSVQQRCILIDRSRARHSYPRPWGIAIEMKRKVVNKSRVRKMQTSQHLDNKTIVSVDSKSLYDDSDDEFELVDEDEKHQTKLNAIQGEGNS